MSGGELALHEMVNIFCLTRVGVRGCVGGFWLKYNTQLIAKNKFEIGSPVVVDENLFCCCVGLYCLCLFFANAERRQGQYGRPFTRRRRFCPFLVSAAKTLSLQSSRVPKARF